MPSLKKTFLTTVLVLGSISSYFAHADDRQVLQPFELRLQQLTAEQSETNRLEQLLDLYWDWYLEQHPDEATYLGYAGNHDRWPDLSLVAIEQRSVMLGKFIEILSTIPPSDLDDKDKMSHGILTRILKEEEANLHFGSHYLAIDQMSGIHLHIPLIIGLMPTKHVADYENILSRLRLFPQLFQQAEELLMQGVEAGITPPRVAIKGVPQQILNQIVDNPFKSPLLKAFTQFPETIDPQTQARLLNEAQEIYQQKVIPALSEFYRYIADDYLPKCRKTTAFSKLPNGDKWYAHLVQSSTTTQLTPQEIHERGLQEVERIHAEMLKLIKEIGFKGTFEEFLNFLKTDPQFFYSNRDELLKGYQTLARHIESKIPLLFGTLPSLPFEVVPVPSYAEESQPTAFYCPGSVADQRPGLFFINTSYPEHRAKWEMVPLALHEAVPGHHLQIALAQELQHLHPFRKNVQFTAYIEGWGLYAESLGTELGLYQDPYSRFGKLTYEMLRSIRLVVDTGMHAMGWSRELSIAYFKKYLSMSQHEIVTEIDRYLVMPGQALAYKIGELKLQELRSLSKAKLKGRFNIQEFHHAWLQHGTLPLDLVEQNILEWIADQNK